MARHTNQIRGTTRPTCTKAEIKSDGDVLCTQCLKKELFNKLLGCQQAERTIEGAREHVLHAESLKQSGTLTGCGDSIGGGVDTPKHSGGVGLERESRWRESKFSRGLAGPGEQDLMPSMHTVKVSDGHSQRLGCSIIAHQIIRPGCFGCEMRRDSHWVGSRAVRGIRWALQRLIPYRTHCHQKRKLPLELRFDLH